MNEVFAVGKQFKDTETFCDHNYATNKSSRFSNLEIHESQKYCPSTPSMTFDIFIKYEVQY